jgi:hypothetical protein
LSASLHHRSRFDNLHDAIHQHEQRRQSCNDAASPKLLPCNRAIRIGIAVSLGIRPGGAINFGDGPQLLAANANLAASVLGVSLATLSPALALPFGLGLYVMLKQAKAYALFGAVMFYVGMTIAFVHEFLRIALFASLPPAYAAATEAARPAILVLGDLIQHAQEMFDLMAFVVVFGLGFSAFALAILNLHVVPRWLGWVLLVLAVGIGLICRPLGYFGVAAAGVAVGLGMLVFFVWLAATGIVLLRWIPPRESAPVG